MHVTIIDSIYLSRIRKYITGYQNMACGGFVGVARGFGWVVFAGFGWGWLGVAGVGWGFGVLRGLARAANVKLGGGVHFYAQFPTDLFIHTPSLAAYPTESPAADPKSRSTEGCKSETD